MLKLPYGMIGRIGAAANLLAIGTALFATPDQGNRVAEPGDEL
jgi:hypothetical protein